MKPLSTATLLAHRADTQSLLATVGAHHWTPQAISAYMKKAASGLKPNGWWYLDRAVEFITRSENPRRIDTWVANPLVWFSLLISGVSAMAIVIVAIAATFGAAFATWGVLGHWAGILMTSAATFFVTMLVFNSNEILFPGEWETNEVELRFMDGYLVPPEGILMAKNFLALSPNSTFEISRLSQNRVEFDPVLWALVPTANGIERHAILVWDYDHSGAPKIIQPPV